MSCIIYRLIKLPPGCEGFVMEDPAGDYNIYLNKDSSHERQRRAAEHEIIHINAGHLRAEAYTCAECEDEVLRAETAIELEG